MPLRDCFLQLGLATYALLWVPQPLDGTADVRQFSEGRALEHVDILSDTIGDRLVGPPGRQHSRTTQCRSYRAVEF